MVIAKCLRSPQQSSDGCSCRNSPSPAFPLVTGVELKFDNLRGFFRRRHKLPLFNGFLASLDKQRVATHDPGGFHVSVRRDDDFDFDLADNIQPFGKLRIPSYRPGFGLPPGFARPTAPSKTRGARKK